MKVHKGSNNYIIHVPGEIDRSFISGRNGRLVCTVDGEPTVKRILFCSTNLQLSGLHQPSRHVTVDCGHEDSVIELDHFSSKPRLLLFASGGPIDYQPALHDTVGMPNLASLLN